MFEFDPKILWTNVIAALTGGVGGIVRMLNAKDHSQISWTAILVELLSSGFVGWMMAKAMHALGREGDWVGLACGIAGFAGVQSLVGLAWLIEKVTGVKLLKKKEEKTDEERDGE